jgi:hypothetical protein
MEMSAALSDPVLEKAASRIGVTPIFDLGSREIHVVGLLSWSPPLIATWWRGKSVTIIGVDVDGNFFLRHSDGSVRFWEHAKKSDIVVAKSVQEFVSRLREDANDSLSWGKSKGSSDAT